MEGDVIIESQEGRNLIGDVLGRMEVAIVEEAANAIERGVVLVELGAADGVAFDPDAKRLALDLVKNLGSGIFDAIDLIERLL